MSAILQGLLAQKQKQILFSICDFSWILFFIPVLYFRSGIVHY